MAPAATVTPAPMRKAHVVAVPMAAQGHLNPCMRLCKELAAQGVLVTFVNVDPVHYRIEEVKQQEGASAPVEEAVEEEACQHNGVAEKIRSAHIPIKGPDLSNDFRFSFEPSFESLKSTDAPLEALILELNQQGPPVTCIISDIFMTLPTQKVADKLNIPRIMLFPCVASMLLLLYYVTEGEHISISKVLESLARKAEGKEVVCEGLPGLPATIYNDDLPHYKHVMDDSPYMWNFLAKACRESFARARAVAINTFEGLEGQALHALSKHLSLPIYGVGPLVEPLQKETSTSLWKEDDGCILWLDQQPPLSVLYISFGSITLLSQRQCEEIVEGLLSSQQHFLWVFRPDLVDNLEYSSTLVADVLSRAHGKGYVVNWAPQLQVLSHPSVGGFLTHCGWNSNVEAVHHGVPMLCWPYFAEQALVAKYVVEEWKVGLQFEATSKEGAHLVERDEVERVIKDLMEGEKGKVLRKNAICLKEASSHSVKIARNNIQSLIKSFM